MTNKQFSRRKFVGKCLAGGSAVLSIALLMNSCGDRQSSVTNESKNENQSPAQSSCEDLTGVNNEEVQKRQSLGYVSKAPAPENACGNCSLFIPPASGKNCGGCLLFKGPVNPEGYCVQYAAKGT